MSVVARHASGRDRHIGIASREVLNAAERLRAVERLRRIAFTEPPMTSAIGAKSARLRSMALSRYFHCPPKPPGSFARLNAATAKAQNFRHVDRSGPLSWNS